MNRRKPPRNEALSISFGALEEEDPMPMRGDDDEMVDPLDLGRDDEATEEDPRAGDPFADPPDEEAEAEIEDVSAEPDAEAEDDEPAEPDEDDPKALKAQLEAERQARLAVEREREEARSELAEARKTATEARTKRVDDELEAAEAELERAIEEGESKKQAQLYRKIAQLESEKRELGRQPAPQRQEQSRGNGQIVTINGAAATAWAAGKAWINNPAYEAQNRDLIRVAQGVAEDGLDPNAKPYFEELERRMKLRHPSLFPAAPKTPVTPRQPGKQAVGRVSRDDPPQNRQASRKVVLTKEDIKNMRRFHLDPENKEHVRAYAREKVAASL